MTDGEEEDYSDWPLKNIKEPHAHDVMYGRGGGTNHHPGNKRYRKMVEERKHDYINSKRLDKPLVALDIIKQWRSQKPPGRFLKVDGKTGLWNDVGDKKAREKTSQALREKAPEIRAQQEEEEKKARGETTETEKSTRFASGTKKQGSGTQKPIMARDHSLGTEIINGEETIGLDGFSWREGATTSTGDMPYPPGRITSMGSHGIGPPPPPPPGSYPPSRNGSYAAQWDERQRSGAVVSGRDVSWARVPSMGSIGSIGNMGPPPPMAYGGGPPVYSGSYGPPPPHASRPPRENSMSRGNPLRDASISMPADPNYFRERSGAYPYPPPPPPGPHGVVPYASGGPPPPPGPNGVPYASGGPPPPPPPPGPNGGPYVSGGPPPPMGPDGRPYVSGGPPPPHYPPPPSGSPYSSPPPPGHPHHGPYQSGGGSYYPQPPPPPPAAHASPSSQEQHKYDVDPKIAQTWSGQSDEQMPGDQYDKLSSRIDASVTGRSPKNDLAGRPEMIKRMTSNQNETPETKPDFVDGGRSIKRAALNRDSSAVANALKEKYIPEALSRPAMAKRQVSVQEMGELQSSMHQTSLDSAKPVPMQERSSTIDDIARDILARPISERSSTMEVIEQELAAAPLPPPPPPAAEAAVAPVSIPRPKTVRTQGRLTTEEVGDIMNEPFAPITKRDRA